MEINPEEIVKSKKTPIDNFYRSITAEVTKKDYERKLKKVLCEFLRPLIKGDPSLVAK